MRLINLYLLLTILHVYGSKVLVSCKGVQNVLGTCKELDLVLLYV